MQLKPELALLEDKQSHTKQAKKRGPHWELRQGLPDLADIRWWGAR